MWGTGAELDKPIWRKDLGQWLGHHEYEQMLMRSKSLVVAALASQMGAQHAARADALYNSRANSYNFARAVLDPEYVEALDLLTQWRSMSRASEAQLSRIKSALARLAAPRASSDADNGATLAWIVEDMRLYRFTTDHSMANIVALLQRLQAEYEEARADNIALSTRIVNNKHVVAMLTPLECTSLATLEFNQKQLLERLCV
jgi:hypothetical protein